MSLINIVCSCKWQVLNVAREMQFHCALLPAIIVWKHCCVYLNSRGRWKTIRALIFITTLPLSRCAKILQSFSYQINAAQTIIKRSNHKDVRREVTSPEKWPPAPPPSINSPVNYCFVADGGGEESRGKIIFGPSGRSASLLLPAKHRRLLNILL